LVSGVVIQYEQANSGGVIFVDNIYFSFSSSSPPSSSSTITTGSAPTTSAAPLGIPSFILFSHLTFCFNFYIFCNFYPVQIYSDEVDSGFIDWSFATHSLTNPSPVFSGSYLFTKGRTGRGRGRRRGRRAGEGEERLNCRVFDFIADIQFRFHYQIGEASAFTKRPLSLSPPSRVSCSK
jgi:hypothetical protein